MCFDSILRSSQSAVGLCVLLTARVTRCTVVECLTFHPAGTTKATVTAADADATRAASDTTNTQYSVHFHRGCRT